MIRNVPGTCQERQNGVPLSNQPTNLTNQPTKKIKDDAAKHGRIFMQYLTQSLKTKTGCSGWRITTVTRKLYGLCIGHLKAYPQDQAELSTQIDKLEALPDPLAYLPRVRAIIEDLKQERRAVEGRQSRARQQEPVTFGAVAEGLRLG